MSSYTAVVIHPETGGEGSYRFNTAEHLMERTPVKVIRHFMEIVDKKLLPAESIDYELNAALKSDNGKVVTGMGTMYRDGGKRLPFVVLISENIE